MLRAELARRPSVEGGRLRRASELADALAGGDTESAVAAASGLAGVGEGLTPAGDDLIVGLLHALWATLPQTCEGATAVAERAAARTTTLSAAWLRAAAAGEAVRPWCELIRAIAEGEPGPAAGKVLDIGHSTGPHMLSGFVIGLERRVGTAKGTNESCHPEQPYADSGGATRNDRIATICHPEERTK